MIIYESEDMYSYWSKSTWVLTSLLLLINIYYLKYKNLNKIDLIYHRLYLETKYCNGFAKYLNMLTK